MLLSAAGGVRHSPPIQLHGSRARNIRPPGNCCRGRGDIGHDRPPGDSHFPGFERRGRLWRCWLRPIARRIECRDGVAMGGIWFKAVVGISLGSRTFDLSDQLVVAANLVIRYVSRPRGAPDNIDTTGRKCVQRDAAGGWRRRRIRVVAVRGGDRGRLNRGFNIVDIDCRNAELVLVGTEQIGGRIGRAWIHGVDERQLVVCRGRRAAVDTIPLGRIGGRRVAPIQHGGGGRHLCHSKDAGGNAKLHRGGARWRRASR